MTCPNPHAVADLNGIPVENGQLVRLIENPGQPWSKWIEGILNIKAPEFALAVTCTDRAGNSTTVTTQLEFATTPGGSVVIE